MFGNLSGSIGESYRLVSGDIRMGEAMRSAGLAENYVVQRLDTRVRELERNLQAELDDFHSAGGDAVVGI